MEKFRLFFRSVNIENKKGTQGECQSQNNLREMLSAFHRKDGCMRKVLKII
jgi:hypothetical protein